VEVPLWAPFCGSGNYIDVLDELGWGCFINERSKPIYTSPIETH